MLAAAGSVAILAGGMALAGSASAASLPSCLNGTRCTETTATPGSISEPGGVAGYYGADDNHTHYRFVQTVVTASPQLIDVNGPLSSKYYPATVGDELCDPNDGVNAQISLGYTATFGWQVFYVVGKFPVSPSGGSADPCIQDNYLANGGSIYRVGTLLGLTGVSEGDQIYLGIYYTPGGHHEHQLSFGACDITSGECRQAYTSTRYSLNFWEFGIGAFAPAEVLTGGAVNLFDTFSYDQVTCYSCSHAVNVSAVQPVNQFGIGGLYEAEFANSSSQVVMSPNDSLSGAKFSMFNGSTSI
jgi:hypothetical protein